MSRERKQKSQELESTNPPNELKKETSEDKTTPESSLYFKKRVCVKYVEKDPK